MKHLLFISLLMATMAWADNSKNPNQIDLYLGAGERCYDIQMSHFNHCRDVLIGHFVIDKHGNLLSSRYDAKAPFTSSPNITQTVIKYVEGGDLKRFINQNNPKPTQQSYVSLSITKNSQLVKTTSTHYAHFVPMINTVMLMH